MLTAISSPTTHSFYFNILKDYLSFLLVSNITAFLIIKADSFSVSAVCQLQLFEANTHVFTGIFPPQARPLSSASEGNLALLCFLALLWGIGHLDLEKLGAKANGREKLFMREGGSKLKSNCEFSDKMHPISFSANETHPYKSTNSRGSSRI